MAELFLNMMTIGDGNDTTIIGPNYIDMMDGNNNSVLFISSVNNVASINTSLQFNVVPTILNSSVVTHVTSVEYVDQNINAVNTSLDIITQGINILNMNVYSINDYVVGLNTTTTNNFGEVRGDITNINDYLATFKNETDSNFIRVDDNIETTNNNIYLAIDTLNTSVTNISQYVDNLSSVTNSAIGTLNTSIIDLSNYVDNLSSVTNSAANINAYASNLSSVTNSAIGALNTSVRNVSEYVVNLSTVTNSAIGNLNTSINYLTAYIDNLSNNPVIQSSMEFSDIDSNLMELDVHSINFSDSSGTSTLNTTALLMYTTQSKLKLSGVNTSYDLTIAPGSSLNLNVSKVLLSNIPAPVSGQNLIAQGQNGLQWVSTDSINANSINTLNTSVTNISNYV